MVFLLLLAGSLGAAAPPSLQFSVSVPPGVQILDLAAHPEGNGLVAVGSEKGDVIVLRLGNSGEVLWSKQFGGSGADAASAVAIDQRGDILIGGTTESADFPLLNPLIDKASFQGLINSRGFLTRLSADGNILYSSYYYTNGLLSIAKIRVLPSAEILLAGTIGNPFTFGVGSRGFVSKLSASGNRVEFHRELDGLGVRCQGGSGCLPARAQTSVRQLDVRAADGWILVGGGTNSYGMATPDALQTECYCGWGGPTGWVGMLDPSGQLRYLTYLSGEQIFAGGNIGLGLEQLWMASFDSEGNIRTAGTSRAAGFPTTADAHQRTFESCEKLPFGEGLCLPEAPLSYFSVINGTTGKLRASTLYGGKTASLKAAIPDPSGATWMAGDSQPFLILMKSDATGLVGSWPTPARIYDRATPIAGGLAAVNGNQIRRYNWQNEGPRIYALSGTIAPGETVDVYTAGYNAQAWLYFDGVLADADEVPGEPGHWKAKVPGGIARNAIIDIALIADEQLSVTKVSTN